jgi:hypothetical protein
VQRFDGAIGRDQLCPDLDTKPAVGGGAAAAARRSPLGLFRVAYGEQKIELTGAERRLDAQRLARLDHAAVRELVLANGGRIVDLPRQPPSGHVLVALEARVLDAHAVALERTLAQVDRAAQLARSGGHDHRLVLVRARQGRVCRGACGAGGGGACALAEGEAVLAHGLGLVQVDKLVDEAQLAVVVLDGHAGLVGRVRGARGLRLLREVVLGQEEVLIVRVVRFGVRLRRVRLGFDQNGRLRRV